MLARFQSVNRAAIRAFSATCATHIQENLGVVVPNGHTSLGVGAENAALVVEVGREQLYSGYSLRSCWVCHGFLDVFTCFYK